MGIIRDIPPAEIEQRSFTIIEQEFLARTGRSPADFDPQQFQVIRRVIHATGDFSYADRLVFHERAIAAGVAAIDAGKDIFIDVMMGAAGINRTLLARFGGLVQCRVNDPEVAERARLTGKTRTETAVATLKAADIGIIAVGNAPTALIATLDLMKRSEIEPDLIVGVPVGFVNAAESKALLMEQSRPFISTTGRKGGSPVAVAIVNALLNIAEQETAHV